MTRIAPVHMITYSLAFRVADVCNTQTTVSLTATKCEKKVIPILGRRMTVLSSRDDFGRLLGKEE